MLIGAAYAYTTETKTCRDTLANLDQVCLQRRNNVTYTGNGVPYIPYIGNLNHTNESNTSEVNSSNDSSLNLTNNETISYSSNLTNQTQNSSNVSR